MVINSAATFTIFFCTGQYRTVCAESPVAPQSRHLQPRNRGQHTLFRLSFTLCDVYTFSGSPLFLQNAQNYKRKKINEIKGKCNGISEQQTGVTKKLNTGTKWTKSKELTSLPVGDFDDQFFSSVNGGGRCCRSLLLVANLLCRLIAKAFDGKQKSAAKHVQMQSKRTKKMR